MYKEIVSNPEPIVVKQMSHAPTHVRRRRMLSPSRSSFAIAAMLLVLACTTSNTDVRPAPGGGAGSGPLIDPSQLGAACSGFGTGIGQTAAFKTDDCPAGICLVDAREDLSSYCSADCATATCPDGWECQPVDLGAAEHACFRVGGDTDGDTTDAAVASGFDAPLTGYLAGANASTTFAISRFKDPSKSATELIVLVVSARWSTFDHALMEDLETATFTKTVIVSVLADGAKVGGGATKTDLAAWHAEYPAHAKVLDSELAVLSSDIGALGSGSGEIEAFPTLIGLDASTLEEVGRQVGYAASTELKATLDAWRAKTK
jgi:hypothetical protein